jgi:hypothetical protein
VSFAGNILIPKICGNPTRAFNNDRTTIRSFVAGLTGTR